jgi:methyl-accepting chemotaxis protein
MNISAWNLPLYRLLPARWRRRAAAINPFRRSPVAAATEVCRRAAGGDLEARINGVDASSEFGQLCHAINAVLDVSDSFVREAAAAMEQCSQDRFHRPILQRGLNGSYEQSARIINLAAARMKTHSENLRFIGRQAADTAGNVHSVATACEELNATVRTISDRAADSAAKARDMRERLDQATASLARLEATVVHVDKVVELLNNVSLNTLFLGLNANIESAHAGQHGLSFGVVAGEIKKLSDQTRLAATEITTEMHEIKETARHVAQTVRGISGLMTELKEAAAAIDESVREQTKVAGSISESILAVSHRSEEISERISNSRQSGQRGTPTP